MTGRRSRRAAPSPPSSSSTGSSSARGRRASPRCATASASPTASWASCSPAPRSARSSPCRSPAGAPPRIGSRRATRVAFALMCLASGVIALAPTPARALRCWPSSTAPRMGSLDVTMNAHGVAVERRYGRAILASFHAAFSIGGLAGGAHRRARGGASTSTCASQLAVVAVVSAAIGLTWSRRFLRRRRRRGGPHRAGLRAPAAAAAGARRAGLRLPADRGRVGRLERGLPARRARHHRGGRRHRLHRLQRHDDARARLRRPPGRPLRPRGVVRAGGGVAAVGFGLALVAAAPVAGDRRLRLPGRRDVGRRADRLPRRRARAGDGRRRRRWPRCRAPATSASSSARRPSAGSPSSSACRRRSRVLVVLAAAVALLAPTTALRARRRAPSPREPQTVRGMTVDPLRPRRRARRLARLDHARLALVGRRARRRVRGDRERPARAARRARSSPRSRRTSTPRPSRAPSTCARPTTSTASIALPGAHELFAGSRPGRDRDLVHGAAGHRAPARGRARPCPPCWSRPSACRAASPIPRATCSPPASWAPRPPTASCSRTRRRASRPAARPACTSSASPPRTIRPSSTPTSSRRRSPPGCVAQRRVGLEPRAREALQAARAPRACCAGRSRCGSGCRGCS